MMTSQNDGRWRVVANMVNGDRVFFGNVDQRPKRLLKYRYGGSSVMKIGDVEVNNFEFVRNLKLGGTCAD